MAHIDVEKQEIVATLIYYGPHQSGKTSNMDYVYTVLKSRDEESEPITIQTLHPHSEAYYELLPLSAGKVEDFTMHFLLYTVPGRIHYRPARLALLQEADGVIFVADSQEARLQENLESWQELQEFFAHKGIDPLRFPLVMQWNKRDLAGVLPVELLAQQLNPYHAPSVEAVTTQGEGVINTLRIGINAILHHLETLAQ